jgi:hypothetical protein
MSIKSNKTIRLSSIRSPHSIESDTMSYDLGHELSNTIHHDSNFDMGIMVNDTSININEDKKNQKSK